jgi:thiamine biosynthesis lipoprotein
MRVVLAVLLTVLLFGCGPGLERYEFTRVQMGVQARIVTYAPSARAARGAAAMAFARIAQLDQCMSDYRESSELMRLCRAPAGQPTPISDDLFRVLSLAHELSAQSGGAFDVTAGPASHLWLQVRREGRPELLDQLPKAMQSVGYEALALDSTARTATLKKPGMRLDLGGIGKGYAAQEALDLLRRLGLAQSLVALAGDIAAGEAPRGSPGWRVPIGGGAGVLLVSDAAVSTSGDTEQFVELGGRRYSHIVDPRTGLGVSRGVMATVVSPRGAMSDALATALCVVESHEVAALLERYPGSAAIIDEGSGPKALDPRGILRFTGPAGSAYHSPVRSTPPAR